MASAVLKIGMDIKDYNQAAKELLAEQRLINSELKASETVAKASGNAFDSLKAKQDALTKKVQVGNQQVTNQKNLMATLNQTLEKQKQRQTDLAQSVQAATMAHTAAVNAYGADSKAAKELEENLIKLEKQQKSNANAIETTNNKLTTATTNLNKYTAEVTENETALKNFKVDAMANGLDTIGQKAQSVGNTLTTHLTVPIVAAGAAAGKAAIDYEDAFAGVRKTVGGTEEQLKKLSDGILALSERMPESATEIAGVAEAAGQLGIKTESILSFTETMVKLGDTTNLTSEEAATALARVANVTQMSQDNFDRLGSSVVALGNNYATTEAEIVNMGQNLAAAGYQVGMSEADIMALAAAMSSVGIEAEAGGTAMSKLMIEIQLATEQGGESLNQFATVAGMSADDFSTAFKDNAAKAITAFVTGLNDTERTGKSAIATLDEMGISEVRMRNAILSLSSSGDLLNNTLATSEGAWESNTALQDEAAKRYETTASKLKILWNQAVEVAIKLGDEMLPVFEDAIDAAEGIIEWFGSLTDEQKKAVVQFGATAAAAGPVISAFGKMSSGIGGIVKQFGSGGIVTKIGSFTTKLTGMGTAATGSGTALASTSAGLAGMAAAAIPVTIGVGTLIALFATQKQINDEATQAVKATTDKITELKKANDDVSSAITNSNTAASTQVSSIAGSAQAARDMVGELSNLITAEGETETGKGKILALVEKLNETIPGLNLNYDNTTNSLSNTNDEILENIGNLTKQATTAAYTKMLNEAYSGQADVIRQLSETGTELTSVQGQITQKQKELTEYGVNEGHQYMVTKGEIDKLKEKEKELAGSKDELKQKYEESNKSIEYAQGVIDGTIDPLKELEQANKNAADAVDATGTATDSAAQKLETNGKNGADAYKAPFLDTQSFLTAGTGAALATIDGVSTKSEEYNTSGVKHAGEYISGFFKNLFPAFESGSKIAGMGNAGIQSQSGEFEKSGASEGVSYSMSLGNQSGTAGAAGQSIGGAANNGLLAWMQSFGNVGNQSASGYVGGVANQGSNANVAGNQIGSRATSGAASWQGSLLNAGTTGGIKFADGIGGTAGESQRQASYAASMGNQGFIDGIGAWTIVDNIKAAAEAIWKGFCEKLGINSPSTLFYDAAGYCLQGFANNFTADNWMSIAKAGAQAVYNAFSGGGLSVQGLFEALGSNMAGVGAFGDFLRDKLGLDPSGLMGTINQILFPSSGSSGSGTYIGSGGLQWPSDTSAITDYFGGRESPGGIGSTWHEGVDIGAPYGSPIYAAGSGGVTTAGWYGGYGNAVKIDHGNGLATLYGHMSEVLTSVGSTVRTGETVGLVGSTGNSTGPHIHFSVLVNGDQVDPMSYFGFAVGTRSLPYTMPILAHQNELIVPAYENPYRNSGGSIIEPIRERMEAEVMQIVANALGGAGNGKYEIHNHFGANMNEYETTRQQENMLRRLWNQRS
ncbi:phage tail tape measure protein [Eubacterium barkeri]|uniref:Phage tail tape measure protein, TP901 family, core region n=1 Tax=Eubacterium barkeri TaxID=1528 RepID=A0A1H3BKD0_EUBBA|nr:phage tail tape measure protein [Eubacterium barkeri]SDX42191.1 phage tail tape measure protein, TP901 family, core region [Eubacterium barkeri]